ncbi:TetR/AcrR family transcriptional regulator [Nocardioides sp. W7]|uniref:TetR/AcrR family transcriptional regulator n=1 Tax=Nocardioides sp. W7 TaxID=2931390 RepID=UPI001FD58E05|nr:TetR/AcrR family transcriptional regulator [Nocardioides sp. W7]
MAVQSGTYRGVSAQERTTERRGRLLAATLEVWAASGQRVTMTRICAEAGLTERYFYESFRNLEDAQTAVLEAIATEIEAVTQAAADDAGADPAARIRASVHAFVELVAADPRKGRVAIVEAGALPALRPRRTALLRHFAQRAAEEALELYGADGWGIRNGQVAGLLFVGGVAELLTAWLEGVLDATTDELVDAATAMFVGMHR